MVLPFSCHTNINSVKRVFILLKYILSIMRVKIDLYWKVAIPAGKIMYKILLQNYYYSKFSYTKKYISKWFQTQFAGCFCFRLFCANLFVLYIFFNVWKTLTTYKRLSTHVTEIKEKLHVPNRIRPRVSPHTSRVWYSLRHQGNHAGYVAAYWWE